MNFLRTYIRWIDGFSEKVGGVVGWLTTLMVLVVCYDVFTRYVLNNSLVGVQEAQWHLFAMVFLLGAAFTLKNDGHVRVDVFYSRMSPRMKAMIDLIGCLLFLLPFSVLIIWTSKNFVQFAYMINETSPDPGGLPYRWVLKAMIPFGFFMVFLQGTSMAVRSFLVLCGANPEELTTVDHSDEVV